MAEAKDNVEEVTSVRPLLDYLNQLGLTKQADAAAYFNITQPTMSRWMEKDVLVRCHGTKGAWISVYGPIRHADGRGI